MATTLKSLRGDGAKCEKVATDFWECTAKDGTVWWCSSSSCVKKPAKGVDPDSGGCGCGSAEGGDDGTFASRGRAAYLEEIQLEARETLAAMPGKSAMRALSPVGRTITSRIGELMKQAASAEDWSDETLAAFAGEMSWVQQLVELDVAYRMKDNDNGGGGITTTNCRKVYDDCLEAHGCDDSGWICLCCVPCSIKYSRCIWGGGGIADGLMAI